MLTISPQIFAAFEPQAEKSLPGHMARKLREDHGRRLTGVSDDVLTAFAEQMIGQARALGLTWRSSLYAFTSLGLIIHPRFYQHPAVRAALQDDPFDTPDDRMKRLGTVVPDAVWDEIAATPGRLVT